MRRFAKPLYELKLVPGVRIPPSPPYLSASVLTTYWLVLPTPLCNTFSAFIPIYPNGSATVRKTVVCPLASRGLEVTCAESRPPSLAQLVELNSIFCVHVARSSRVLIPTLQLARLPRLGTTLTQRVTQVTGQIVEENPLRKRSSRSSPCSE